MKRFEVTNNINKQELYDNYKKIGSLRGVAKLYDTSHAVIRNVMNRFGISYDIDKKHSLNVSHNFFSTESLRSYYWAGFIAADGCVYKNYLRLGLAEKDKNHLEEFKKDIESDHKLVRTEHSAKLRPKSICYHLSVSSQCMVKDLERFNIVPRKTHILKFPQIEKEKASAFCRGYFDGDGCWCVHKPSTRPNKSDQMVFSLRGTEEFLKGFNYCLVNYASLPERCLQKSLNGYRVSSLQYNGNKICKKIADWLYSDVSESGIFMERKYNKIANL